MVVVVMCVGATHFDTGRICLVDVAILDDNCPAEIESNLQDVVDATFAIEAQSLVKGELFVVWTL